MSEYIKSPLNYVGGKYKLLPQLLPLFPKDIDTFIDLFGGGANVAVNVKSKVTVYNDINLKVVQILETLAKTPTDEALEYINRMIALYGLTKENESGFLDLRSFYNRSETKPPLMLYTLICYAFNYQIRFNSKGEYNMPFGKNRSSFNDILREKFIVFSKALHNKNIIFVNSDFKEYAVYCMDSDSFIYCDPPYLNSTATYNEKSGWTEKDENILRSLLDKWAKQGVRWALSNNAAVNTDLTDWASSRGYTVHYLDNSYGNSNYHKKDKSDKDKEVLITNY